MKKFINFLYSIPLLGSLLPYLYYFITIIGSKSNEYSYKIDPSFSILGTLRPYIYQFVIVSWIILLINLFILFYELYKLKKKIDKYIVIYFIGVLLTYFTNHFDPYDILNWFFD